MQPTTRGHGLLFLVLDFISIHKSPSISFSDFDAHAQRFSATSLGCLVAESLGGKADIELERMGDAGSTLPGSPWAGVVDILKERSQSQRKMLFFPLGCSAPDEMSYRALYEISTELSLVIRTLQGFRDEAPVLLHLDDHRDTIVWFWAVLLANGLPVLSSPFSNVGEHRRRHTGWLSTLLQSPVCITRARSVPLFDGDHHSFKLHTVEDLLRRRKDGSRQGTIEQEKQRSTRNDENAAAVLTLTSGSTGNAKAVCTTQRQILAAINGKAACRALTPDGPFLNWIGLDHIAGLVEMHIQPMWLGVGQIHVHAANVTSQPALFLRLLSRYRVSRTFAPNFFLAELVSAMDGPKQPPLDAKTWDLSDLAVFASGGEANDVKTCVAASALLERYGAPRNVITPGFGMTETCAGAIFNLDCPAYEVQNGLSAASLGKCIEGMEMRIAVKDDPYDGSSRSAANEPGELQVRGDVVFSKYYRNPEATSEAFTPDGWFRTGDQAIIDPAGNLRLIGRLKDVININGIKIATSDVQAALEEALGSRVARVVAFPARAEHTEQITVAYVPKEWPLEARTMVDIESLAVEACIMSGGPRPLVFQLSRSSVSKLPLSALGKISRAKMRVLFEEGVFSDDVERHSHTVGDFKEQEQVQQQQGSEAANDAELSLLVEDIAQTIGISRDGVRLDASIFELGCKSMDLIRLKHRIDTRLGTEVPIVMLMKHPTARSMAAALSILLGRSGSCSLGEGDAAASIIADYDPVVTFRPGGSKTPLWLVHPGVGEVLVFIGLVQHMSDDDRPIYALRARGFEAGHKNFGSIEETVEAYVAAMRSRQPQGPYALAGYSYGTMLAFEMAKILEGEGDRVKFLGSFNLPPHIKTRMRQLNWNMCLLHLTYFVGLISEEYNSNDDDNLLALDRGEALKRVMSEADMDRMRELGLDEQGLARWADVAFGLQSMAVDYEPGGTVEALDVFHAMPLKVAARSREEWLAVHLSRWRDFCRSDVRFHRVGGEHYTMLGPEHVVGFAATLKAALRDRGV
ncbi:hypothetical protein L249_8273 [Ophiocordyceps polyrhachis-furcata BCC 54312]|uniref:Carrier domain-containing protein n=1 Tax=Ophiocordyceps polyrhachis-furcata BCC 54312 TaxID=1330021 RepID=A0A367LI24_9HYPO|nr:hypothetical protein L249_8273 [Ophiocordyceps polyrhachis-furcata BCC 54312]